METRENPDDLADALRYATEIEAYADRLEKDLEEVKAYSVSIEAYADELEKKAAAPAPSASPSALEYADRQILALKETVRNYGSTILTLENAGKEQKARVSELEGKALSLEVDLGEARSEAQSLQVELEEKTERVEELEGVETELSERLDELEDAPRGEFFGVVLPEDSGFSLGDSLDFLETLRAFLSSHGQQAAALQLKRVSYPKV